MNKGHLCFVILFKVAKAQVRNATILNWILALGLLFLFAYLDQNGDMRKGVLVPCNSIFVLSMHKYAARLSCILRLDGE